VPSTGLDEVQKRLGYRFHRDAWLLEALTHKSYLNEAHGTKETDNERLEFLGDSVLNLAVSDYLVKAFPDASEGDLSKLRAGLVSEESLAQVGRRLGLGEALRLGRGEELTRGREKSSILADAVEAVMAAVYLDGGLDAASCCVKDAFGNILEASGPSIGKTDFKTDLQEICQRAFNTLPHYGTVRESGPDHDKLFEVEVLIRGDRHGSGVGKSKKEAEQKAAKQALEHLGQSKEDQCDIRSGS